MTSHNIQKSAIKLEISINVETKIVAKLINLNDRASSVWQEHLLLLHLKIINRTIGKIHRVD